MRRRLLDHTYKKTVTGNPAVAKSVARMYPDISFPGFTTQDGEPSPENPVDIVNAQSPVKVEISDGGENIQAVTINSDRPITKWDKLIKQNGIWGWEYWGYKYTVTGDEEFKKFSESVNYFRTGKVFFNKLVVNSYSNMYIATNALVAIKNNEYVVREGAYLDSIFIMDNRFEDVESQKNYFKDLYENDTPLIFEFKAVTPEFAPLSQEEQTMLNALHTNNPTTIVQNSIGTDVTLTYKTKRSLEVAQ